MLHPSGTMMGERLQKAFSLMELMDPKIRQQLDGTSTPNTSQVNLMALKEKRKCKKQQLKLKSMPTAELICEI
jgi:hypothetical protein